MRRRRTVAAALAVTVVAVVAWFAIRPSGSTGAHGSTRPHPAAAPSAQAAGTPGALTAAESGLLPWHLIAPLSREVVVPGSPGQLIVLGGLTPAGTSASGVYTVGTATGAARQVGALSAPLHDAAGVSAGGRALVFGGGSPVTVGTVQAFSGAGTGRVTGSLPAPRSDAAAVTIGGTAYVVGGYDGSKPDAAVLATTDGQDLYHGGGATGPGALPGRRRPGRCDLRVRRAGHQGPGRRGGGDRHPGGRPGPAYGGRHRPLPEPLAGAAAVTVDGEVFVAGGDSPAAQPQAPGLGTTQLSGAVRGGRASRPSGDLGFRPRHQAAAATRPAPGAGISRRGRGDRVHRLDRRRRIRRRAGLGGADAAPGPRLRHRGRAGGGLAVLRGQAAHRGPR